MDHSCRIALLLDRSLSFVRGVLQGIRAYAAKRPQWVMRDGPPRLHMVDPVREWRPHGIIAGLVLPQVARALMRMRKPLVDTAFALPGLKVPTVDVDHAAVGRMAAEYYLERKFARFAFYGSPIGTLLRRSRSGHSASGWPRTATAVVVLLQRLSARRQGFRLVEEIGPEDGALAAATPQAGGRLRLRGHARSLLWPICAGSSGCGFPRRWPCWAWGTTISSAG